MKPDLLQFLMANREEIKKQIQCKNYDSDLDELIILWTMYEIVQKNIIILT